MTERYAFQLGRESEIAIAEIHEVLTRQNISFISEKKCGDYLLLQPSGAIDASALIRRLGGTIKICREIPLRGGMAEAAAAYLDSVLPEEKIHFSITGGGGRLGLEIKKILKEMGRSVRYVEPKNTATILHNQLVERKSDLSVIDSSLFVTVGIQPFEEWGYRDFGRPGRDSVSGMLPPKLARIMLNLSGTEKNTIILDPFCGSGTILMEALLLGYTHIIGSDLSAKAIEDSQKNSGWIRDTYNLQNEPKLITCDVQTLHQKILKESVGCIVTEPYLGKPQTGRNTLLNLQEQIKELSKLYTAAFTSFSLLLAPGGSIVWIMPSFRYGKDWLRFDTKSIVGKKFQAETLGRGTPYLFYARDDQYVGREIWKFIKTK